MGPTWSILMATIGQRRNLLARMLGTLLPQVDEAAGRVRVLAYWDSGELADTCGSALAAIAHKRETLLAAATGEYVCWLDDDDWVTDDYVSSILAALDERPDMVGFRMQVHRDGRPDRIGEMSLQHTGWENRPRLYARDITHANPMRTDIARTASFLARGDGPEDVAWVGQLRAGGLLKSEVFIPRVLQHHDWVPARSTWGVPGRVRTVAPDGRPWERLEVSSPYFSWLEP